MAPAAGSCPAPSMTVTALLLRTGCDFTPATFVPRLSQSTSRTFPALLPRPSRRAKPGAALDPCPVVREIPCPGAAPVFWH